MMESIFSNLTKGMRLNPGISESQLIQITSTLNKPLPKDYEAFLMFSNGARGMIGGHFLKIVRAEELIQFNSDYSVKKDAPGLFIFGTDGGGEAYGFDYRELDPKVVMVPFIGMDWDQAIEKGENFLDFLQNLSTS